MKFFIDEYETTIHNASDAKTLCTDLNKHSDSVWSSVLACIDDILTNDVDIAVSVPFIPSEPYMNDVAVWFPSDAYSPRVQFTFVFIASARYDKVAFFSVTLTHSIDTYADLAHFQNILKIEINQKAGDDETIEKVCNAFQATGIEIEYHR